MLLRLCSIISLSIATDYLVSHASRIVTVVSLHPEVIATPALATKSRRAGITNTPIRRPFRPRPRALPPFSSPPPCDACPQPAAAPWTTPSSRAQCIGNPTPTFRGKQLPFRVCRVAWWGAWLAALRTSVAGSSLSHGPPSPPKTNNTRMHTLAQLSLIHSSPLQIRSLAPRMHHVDS